MPNEQSSKTATYLLPPFPPLYGLKRTSMVFLKNT